MFITRPKNKFTRFLLKTGNNDTRRFDAPPWLQHYRSTTTKEMVKLRHRPYSAGSSQAINSWLAASPRTNLPTQLGQLLADFAIAGWLDARACSNFIPAAGRMPACLVKMAAVTTAEE